MFTTQIYRASWGIDFLFIGGTDCPAIVQALEVTGRYGKGYDGGAGKGKGEGLFCHSHSGYGGGKGGGEAKGDRLGQAKVSPAVRQRFVL